MYDWDDKDGEGKISRLYKKLQSAGYSPEMKNKMRVILNHPEMKARDIRAYASSWHDVGLIFITTNYGVYEIGTTHSVDKAFDMIVDTYKSFVEGYPYVEKDCRYKMKFPDEGPGDGLIHCMAYSYSHRKDGKHWGNYPVCCAKECPLANRDLLEGATLDWVKV